MTTQFRHSGERRCPFQPWVPAVKKFPGRAISSSPRKRGPRSQRPKSLGSRFRGNDGYENESTRFRDWVPPSCAGMTLLVAAHFAAPTVAGEIPKLGGTLTYLIAADAPPSFD